MVESMMANGKIVYQMEKVLYIMLMVESMMASGKMIKQMEKVLCI
jgi:cell division protein FtsL